MRTPSAVSSAFASPAAVSPIAEFSAAIARARFKSSPTASLNSTNARCSGPSCAALGEALAARSTSATRAAAHRSIMRWQSRSPCMVKFEFVR